MTRSGIGACNDDEIRIAARGNRRLYLARGLEHVYDRARARQMAAALGRDLVFDVDGSHPRRFVFLHGVAHVDCIAVAGIGIADQRYVHARRRAMRVLRKQREIDEPDVGPAQQRCRDAVARHVDRFASRLFDKACAVGIVNAGRDYQRSAGKTRAQALAWGCWYCAHLSIPSFFLIDSSS